MKTLRHRIAAGLESGLPGPTGQGHMAPRPRVGWVPGHWPSDARQGAGLILLYPFEDQAHLLITLRAGELNKHANQVSLPGGAVDPGETIEQGALREAEEEVGASPQEIEVVGRLTPLHIPVSGFVLHPVIGITETPFEPVPNPGEVSRVLHVPLEPLLAGELLDEEQRTWREQQYRVPIFNVDGEVCWGATAMIVSEFLTLLGAPPQTRDDEPSPL